MKIVHPVYIQTKTSLFDENGSIISCEMSEEIRETISRQVDRMIRISAFGSEMPYPEFFVPMPWKKS